MTEAKIVSLNGDSILPGERSEDVVQTLRTLLEQAERGEISAIAYTLHRPNREVAWSWSGGGSGVLIAAGISLLQTRYMQAYCLSEGFD